MPLYHGSSAVPELPQYSAVPVCHRVRLDILWLGRAVRLRASSIAEAVLRVVFSVGQRLSVLGFNRIHHDNSSTLLFLG
jgi:hypothetical protein